MKLATTTGDFTSFQKRLDPYSGVGESLVLLKECGFNTVETYTEWGILEPREGEFDFSFLEITFCFLSIKAFFRTIGLISPFKR